MNNRRKVIALMTAVILITGSLGFDRKRRFILCLDKDMKE